MHEWILALMLLAAPADAPRDRFDEVASAIETVARAHPVYDSDDAVERTVAELVALSAREGHFDPGAIGRDAYGESYGLGQIHVSNLKTLGVTREQMLDPVANLTATATLLRRSHRLCRARPPLEQLAWYASGGPTCDVPAGLAASRVRAGLAIGLLMRRPPFWTDVSIPLAKSPLAASQTP